MRCLPAAKVVCWINWIQLAILGGYTGYYSLWGDRPGPAGKVEPTRVVLGWYICIFGLLGCAVEAGVEALVAKLKFLTTLGSKGFFFFFVGSLGMSFGWYSEPAALLVPFFMGLFSCIAAIVCWIGGCESDKQSQGVM